MLAARLVPLGLLVGTDRMEELAPNPVAELIGRWQGANELTAPHQRLQESTWWLVAPARTHGLRCRERSHRVLAARRAAPDLLGTAQLAALGEWPAVDLDQIHRKVDEGCADDAGADAEDVHDMPQVGDFGLVQAAAGHKLNVT